jgi:hypothetical protein
MKSTNKINLLESPSTSPVRNELVRPALQQLGTLDCPVCRHEVAIYLTKTRRPFLNCGFCSVRVFYNGMESIRRLTDEMKPMP